MGVPQFTMVASILSHGLMTWKIWGTPMTLKTSLFIHKHKPNHEKYIYIHNILIL